MRREYDLHTDVLETIVADTPVTKQHAALLSALGARSDFCGAQSVMTRDEFSERSARILDAQGGEVAADASAWLAAQLAEHAASARAVWSAFKDAGYWLTERQPVLHHFVSDRGGTATLLLDGQVVASTHLAHTVPWVMSYEEGMNVGVGAGTPVSEDYRMPFAFNETLRHVDITLK